MSKILKFVWIDDEDRERYSLNLEKQLGVKCEFVDVQPEDVSYMDVINEIKPDLILVDHNLTEIGTGEIKKGSTIAALIRETHPTYAIACVTGQDIDGIDSQQRQAYEAIFSLKDIKEHYLTMKAIALAYRKMKAKPLNKIDNLFDLMKAPEEEYMRLETILPHEIKENFKDKGVYANISHWIRNILMERPGFLYDHMWAATLLGLNENGFKKVEGLFTQAKYKGIFADKSRERWWKGELLQVLSKLVKKQGLPWEKGRDIDGINTRNYSRDYYTDFKEEFPEVIAYIDETSDERAQMKLKYTVPHPKFDKLLFFDEIRMMKSE